MISAILISQCARSPLKNREDALQLKQMPKNIDDQADKESFSLAIQSCLNVLQSLNPENEIIFGKQKISIAQYIEQLQLLQQKIDSSVNVSEYTKYIEENFLFLQVYGNKNWGEAKVTGYYIPYFPAAKKKSAEFSQPIYAKPEDIYNLDLAALASVYPKLADALKENTKLSLSLRIDDKNKRVIPYYTRAEIDSKTSPYTKKQEILYMKPFDAFEMQIQGSGVAELENGDKVYLGYAGQNGHPYTPIGKALLDKIPLAELSMQKIREVYLTLSEEEQQNLLNINASYVYFSELKDKKIVGQFKSEMIAQRNIASDKAWFPSAGLAYLEWQKPSWNQGLLTHQEHKIFVFDTDTGGAIKGPGRADYFWGYGPEAGELAGRTNTTAKIWYLFPKQYYVAD